MKARVGPSKRKLEGEEAAILCRSRKNKDQKDVPRHRRDVAS